MPTAIAYHSESMTRTMACVRYGGWPLGVSRIREFVDPENPDASPC